jgi:hypothetical protein
VRISLRSKGGTTYCDIDSADAELAERRWHLNRDGYVVRNYWIKGKCFTEFLARTIMSAPAGVEVDHKDGNKLNNRRSNLRLATRGQQNQNRVSWAASGYKGVHRNGKRWKALVHINGERHYLGTFDTPEEANDVAIAFRTDNYIDHRPEEKLLPHAQRIVRERRIKEQQDGSQ